MPSDIPELAGALLNGKCSRSACEGLNKSENWLSAGMALACYSMKVSVPDVAIVGDSADTAG